MRAPALTLTFIFLARSKPWCKSSSLNYSTAPSPITQFTSHRIYWFAWSRDGKQLALARGNTVGDAVLLRHVPLSSYMIV
jgi:hypothetical protein